MNQGTDLISIIHQDTFPNYLPPTTTDAVKQIAEIEAIIAEVEADHHRDD